MLSFNNNYFKRKINPFEFINQKLRMFEYEYEKIDQFILIFKI